MNSRGVAHFDDATVYTTAKNLRRGRAPPRARAAAARRAEARSGGRATRPATRRQWLGVVAVACIGGSVPFVLFFEGLARADATQAAFIHKTLVVWVALLAVPLLRERLGPAARGGDRARARRPGLARRWGRDGRLRRRRDHDPGGDAALGGRGRAREAAARRAGAAARSPRRGWRWERSFSSAGSRFTGRVGRPVCAGRRAVGLGRPDRAPARRLRRHAGTRRSRARRPST